MDLTVVGMMSGTSHDAVDAAVGDWSLDGDTVALTPRGVHSVAIPAALRDQIAACLPPSATTLQAVCRLDTELGQLFGAVARAAISRLAPGGADLVVSHGQTVFHWVDGGRARGTLQLGAPAWIAEACGATVVSDLRSADIARGGHGAPLASILDALLVLPPGPAGAGGGPRRGSLNLGGIANITVRGDDGAVLAYDLGPANALLDAAAAAASAGRARMDAGGTLAACGTVDRRALQRLLDDDYYRLAPPKSTGKERFHAAYVGERLGDGSEVPTGADLLATLTELSARLVADACAAHRLTELVVAGGGVRNPTLMARIAACCGGGVRIRPFEDFSLPAQAKEAYLFGLLGYLTVHGLPATIPSATGARSAALLGSITPGGGGLALPARALTPIRRMRVAPATMQR